MSDYASIKSNRSKYHPLFLVYMQSKALRVLNELGLTVTVHQQIRRGITFMANYTEERIFSLCTRSLELALNQRIISPGLRF